MENENFGYQPPVPPVSEKKQFKGKISYMSGGLLLYNVIMYAVVFAAMVIILIVKSVISAIHNDYFDADKFLLEYQETDMGMGIGVILGCLFMWLFNIKRIKPKEIFAPRPQKMTAGKFLMLLSVLMCIQLPITLFDGLVETLLNLAGLSAQAAIESSQAGSTTISMMLYAGFIGPFAEEFIYRGYSMRTLESTGAGKGYALIISSLLFGIMHANPTQSVYAFFAGMVFGYVAIEYGIIWSILMHIANNFLFGDVMVYISGYMSEEAAEIFDWALFIGLFIAGITVLIVKRKTAVEYIRKTYQTDGKYYKWTFTNILFLLFIIINILLAVSTITTLET